MTEPAAASSAPATEKTEQPWEKNYPAGIKWDANIPVTTMVEMFKESVAKYGDRPCLNFFGRQWTYKQVDEMSDRFAKSLQDQGIGKGNHIGLCLPDLPFHVIAYYGAMKAGATVVNFNPLYAEKEMAELINDSKTDMMVTFNNKQLQAKLDKLTGTTAMKKTIVCDLSDVLPPKKKYGLAVLTFAKKAVAPLLPLINKLPGDTKVQKDDHGKPIPLKGAAKFKKSLQDFSKIDLFDVVEDDKHVAFSSMMKSTGAVAPVDVKPDDIAVLQYTGGTTGIPKACMLTHANLTANIAQSEMWFSSKKDPNAPEKQEKMFAILPFFHVFAMTVQENLALKLGAELVMRPIPDIKKAVQVIDKYKPEMFAAVPSMYEAMLATKVPKVSTICKIFNKVAHPLTPVKKEYDLSSVKLWLTGGAPTPEPLEEAWKKRTGKAFTKGYGLSETSPLAIAIPLGEDIPGSIGLPVPGTEVRITSIENSPDISDKVLALGEVGEICLRGPQVMKGYHNRPDETAKVMDKDGYFHTGDTGYIDPKTGAIFITGRTKDMINRQGLKVFPLKVESKLLDHPAIKEVCVVGVPDPKVQEEVKAHIVFHPGQSATPAEIKAFLQDKLAPYEIPHLWKFRDDFPRTLKQQPDKKALKKEDLAELEAKAANTNKPAAPATPKVG